MVSGGQGLPGFLQGSTSQPQPTSHGVGQDQACSTWAGDSQDPSPWGGTTSVRIKGSSSPPQGRSLAGGLLLFAQGNSRSCGGLCCLTGRPGPPSSWTQVCARAGKHVLAGPGSSDRQPTQLRGVYGWAGRQGRDRRDPPLGSHRVMTLWDRVPRSRFPALGLPQLLLPSPPPSPGKDHALTSVLSGDHPTPQPAVPQGPCPTRSPLPTLAHRHSLHLRLC